jgi:hypothetical protein
MNTDDIRKKWDAMPGPWVKRKRGMFYRPNNRGYTTNVSEAGLFTKEDALKEEAENPSVISVAPFLAYREDAARGLEVATQTLALMDAILAAWQEKSVPCQMDHRFMRGGSLSASRVVLLTKPDGEFPEVITQSPPNGWEYGTVDLFLRNPDRKHQVEAWRRGPFAVHEIENPKAGRLTHAPTGRHMFTVATLDDAARAAEAIEGMTNWSEFSKPTAYPDLFKQVRACVESIGIEILAH